MKYVLASLLVAFGAGALVDLNQRHNVTPKPVDGDPNKGMDYTHARWPRLDNWVNFRLKPLLKY